jgi:hypothetical protein
MLAVNARDLIGQYTPPDVRRGDRVFCKFRLAWCRVTSWSDAPVSWPRVQQIGIRGGSGLLVNAELRRAIRTESAEAIMHHFGVKSTAVWRWRTWAGAGGHTGTKGTRRAMRAVALKGAATMREPGVTDAERVARSRHAKAVGKKYPDRWEGKGGWTTAEVALLDTEDDDTIARKTGRSEHAIRAKRRRLKLAN